MVRPVEDAGATARAVKPLALPVYDPARLPDPAACTGALIVINDRTDGNPHLRLALSNGASWDRVALSVDGAAPGVDLDALCNDIDGSEGERDDGPDRKCPDRRHQRKRQHDPVDEADHRRQREDIHHCGHRGGDLRHGPRRRCRDHHRYRWRGIERGWRRSQGHADRIPHMSLIVINSYRFAAIGGIDSFTKLCLHCDGSDASTTFTDSSASAHTLTAHGDAQVDTDQSKFGGASLLVDGTGDWIDAPDSSDWDFGSGDFTVDFWFRPSGVAVNGHVIGQKTGSSAAAWVIWQAGGSLVLYASTDGISYDIAAGSSLGTLTTDTWAHYALERSGSTWNLYKNGTLTTTFSSSATIHNSTSKLSIGASDDGANPVGGHIDEVRISKGVARYGGAFTPPAGPYTVI